MQQQFLAKLPPTPPSPAYTRLCPFGSGSNTVVNVPTWLARMFSSPALLIVLAAIYYQDRSRRKNKPYTYVEIALRAGLCRNTIAWALWFICQTMVMVKETRKDESYWQTVGKANNRHKKLCKRNRSVSRINWTLIQARNQEEARKRRKEEWDRRKQEKAEKLKALKDLRAQETLPTPLKKPPSIFNGNKSSDHQLTPNLGLLEALFEENKIRSYKMDGDMRNRRFMARVLKVLKTADLILATSLFAQNRFLMDANAHGWRVARANALRNEGQEPWVNGKHLNGYQNWCPSQVWFVRNLHKILAGDYTYRTREERARMREEVEAVSEAPDHPLTPLKPSLEALAFAGKKQREKEAQEAMELEARRDREAAHKGKSYWRDLSLPDRAKLEARFIEAIEKGETTYPATTNTRDRFFKMMKESMLLTWLGHQLAPIQDERKDHAS